MRLKRAAPRIPVTVQLPVAVAEQLRRLQEQYDDSAPKLIARSLAALEEKTADTAAA
jgi:hypothetical protein